MATVNSVKSGLWSDSTVWDAGGVPTVGDVVYINNDHVVEMDYVYDGDTNYISNLVINSGGTLKASRISNSQLVTSVVVGIQVNGTLDYGTETDPIPASVTANIYHKATADGQTMLQNTGNQIFFHGSGDYFGNLLYTTLYEDWSSGNIIKVVDDVTNKWRVGQELIIHFNGLYTGINSDVRIVTIQSIGSYNGSYTEITVSAAPNKTYYAGGLVVNLSRNVEIGKFGATRVASYNSNRPTINLTSINYIKYTSFIGTHYVFLTYAINTKTDFQYNVLRNNHGGVFFQYEVQEQHYIKNNVVYYTNYFGLKVHIRTRTDIPRFYPITIENNIAISSIAAQSSEQENVIFQNSIYRAIDTISVQPGYHFNLKNNDIAGCGTIGYGTRKVINCNIYNCYTIFSGYIFVNIPLEFCNCRFGYDINNNLKQNYYDFATFMGGNSQSFKVNFINCIFSRWPLYNRNDATGHARYIYSDFISWNHNKNQGDHRLFINGVEVVRNLSIKRYRSPESLQVNPMPDIRGGNNEYGLILYEGIERDVEADVQQTRTFYIMPVNFWNLVDLINNDNLRFEAEYLDNNGEPVVVTSSYLDDDSGGDWLNKPSDYRLKKLVVQYTLPYKQDVKYRIKFALYQANSNLYVDTKMYRQSANGRYLRPIDIKWDITKRTFFDEPYVDMRD